MTQDNLVNNKNSEWGNPRINQNSNIQEKNNPNKSTFNSPQQAKCCHHLLNEDLSSDFSVSSAKYTNAGTSEESTVAIVTFKCRRKRLYQNSNHLALKQYEYVVAQVENGIDLGTICSCGADALQKQKTLYKDEVPEFTIIRHASLEDLNRLKKNDENEQNVLEKTRDYVKNFNLDMKVTEAEWQLDRQRLTIYFTAPQRIDFRELVKELARSFKTRIELRQISTREEAKRIGGMGPCGLHLCCSSFVSEFSHITLDHARDQQLANNVAKLSGYCGRLKCCLLYEHDTYLEEYKNYPPIHSLVELPEGKARIIKIDIFKKIVHLHIGSNGTYKSLSCLDIDSLSKAGKISPPAKDEHIPQYEFDDLDELAYFDEEDY